MFGWFKREKRPAKKKFTFIWYHRMHTGNKTHFSQHFKTTVEAETYTQGKEMVEKFAQAKMQLVIVKESDFKYTDLAKFENSVAKMNESMESLFNNFNTN